MRRARRALWTVPLLWAAAAGADEVHLRGGGTVCGVIVERTDTAVVIETGPGRVTLPLARVSRIVDGPSALESFQERALQIPAGDVDALADLARWAADHDLATSARQTWERVLALDPDHPEANAALGRVRLGGFWMSEEDAYRARGYVHFEGRWVTSAERDALVSERARAERRASERRQAELQVREAEARAREAEARARAAEANAERTDSSPEGIPYWWILGGGGGPWIPAGPTPPVTRPEPPAPPVDPGAPPPTSRSGSSIGPISSRPPNAPASGGVPPHAPAPTGGPHKQD